MLRIIFSLALAVAIADAAPAGRRPAAKKPAANPAVKPAEADPFAFWKDPDMPPEVLSLLKAGEGERQRLISTSMKMLELRKNQLELHKRGRIKRGVTGKGQLYNDGKRYWFPDMATKKKLTAEAEGEVDKYEQELGRLAAEAGGHVPKVEAFTVGAAGNITYSLRVSQVIDGDSAILQNAKGDAIWLDGVDTSSWTDDASVEVRSVIAITGTKRYETAIGGTRTVPLAKVIDVEPWLAKWRAGLKVAK